MMTRTYDDVLLETNAHRDEVYKVCSRGKQWRWARVRPTYGGDVVVRAATETRVARVLAALAEAGIEVVRKIEGDLCDGSETDYFLSSDNETIYLTMQR
jgi:hypothetical protein